MKPAAPQSIDFDVVPQVGTIVMFHGQRYEMVGVRSHANRTGVMTTLVRWATHCARCGDPTEVATTLKTSPSRRCSDCAQKGIKA